MTKHTISVLVADQPGVLQRVCGLFGRRGYNIDSISVGRSESEGCSRIILVTSCEERIADQICQQLNKLIDVIQVKLLSKKPLLTRELMLIKCHAAAGARQEILGLADTFRCSVIDVGAETMTIQVVGDREKNTAFLQILRPFGIVEVTGTGVTAVNRG
ncbi:acetolactate synthase small subunit [Paenibacillus tarimensis]|uniref:acetolactate synthase small subunit n=1 Tax=Paenibacillus tarimensis TaxID=416012 RepID=UPI001F2660EC|nr:acetolactate synthase small subunit [Paenibacillus tarimensis]MCF2944069.1 acetolactate synthase small subunit [Paenibacillus tarimensis]